MYIIESLLIKIVIDSTSTIYKVCIVFNNLFLKSIAPPLKNFLDLDLFDVRCNNSLISQLEYTI